MPQNTGNRPRERSLRRESRCPSSRPAPGRRNLKSSAGSNIRLSLDHNLWRRTPGACALKLLAHFARNVAIDLRMRTVGFGRDHRKAGVGFFANGHVQRHFPEEWDAETLRLVPRAAMAEDIGSRAAARAEKETHVLAH